MQNIRTHVYAPLAHQEDPLTCEVDGREGGKSDFLKSWRQQHAAASRKLLEIGCVLTISTIAFLVGLRWRPSIDRKCWDLHSHYSPLSKDLNPLYHDRKFNGSLGSTSPYRYEGPLPVPEEVDEAWLGITNERFAYSASEEDFVRSGIPTNYMRLDDYFGGGYAAKIEVFHQLHCLNYLRKGLWFHYPYYTNNSRYGAEFTDQNAIITMHLNHCVEILRQVLMCNSDVGIIGMRWIRGYPRPVPDFSTTHRCRNFDQVVEWAQENHVPDMPRGFRISPGKDDQIFDDGL